MKKRIKKGFTLVELLVVIAILAILSTVAIVGYNSFTEKARISNDKGLVTQLNTLLQADEVTDGKAATPTDALAVVAENGFDVSKMTPTADDYHIVWNEETNRFVLLDENKVAVVEELSASAHKNWQFSSAYTPLVTGYSVRLNDNFEGTSLEVTSGLDVGNNTGIDVVYNGTAEVTIRTNNGDLTVNSGKVNHYGSAYYLTVASGATYNEFGTVVADLANVETIPEAEQSQWTKVATAEELTAALENAEVSKIMLTADINVTTELVKMNNVLGTFIVNKNVEINLNGFNIVGVHVNNNDTLNQNATLFSLSKDATLTLSGYGRVSLKYEGTNMQWNALSSTLRLNANGTINVNDAVIIEHLGGTPMSYAIDAYATGTTQSINLNGGALYSTYIAIRNFYQNTANSKININAGVIEGQRCDIWYQGTSANVSIDDVLSINSSYKVTREDSLFYID